ncbi:MAG TPA: hypothetical protein VIW67_24510 [Terriglobales bacterium]|jgi:hypothetical protein
MCKKSTILLGLFASAILLSVSGCARETRLVQITIQPQSFTFLTPNSGLQVQFTALGRYIHPPETRDITSQVIWKTEAPQIVDVTGAGMVSAAGTGCGIVDVTASSNKDTNSSKDIVVGFATVTVNDPATAVCPGGNATKAVLTVTFAGTGTGTVTSSPGGITCPSGACAAQFTKGDPIALTATPASGSTFGGWSNCPSPSGNACTITLNDNETVTATFN